jgi:hypothetical protein
MHAFEKAFKFLLEQEVKRGDPPTARIAQGHIADCFPSEDGSSVPVPVEELPHDVKPVEVV